MAASQQNKDNFFRHSKNLINYNTERNSEEENHITSLPSDVVSDMREAFSLLDKSGNGEISAEDLGKDLESFGFKNTAEEIQWIMQLADMDGNGTINFVEFVTLITQNLTKENNKQLFKETFEIFDSDGNGVMDRRELSRAFANFGASLTDEEIDALIKEADFDGDDEISVHEFISIMQAGMFQKHRK